MPKVKLDVGATVDFLNKDELADELDKNQQRAEAVDRERLAGVKYLRLPVLVGTVASGTSVCGTKDIIAGPANGYAWAVKRIYVNGLGTADTYGIYRNGTSGFPVWQVTGSVPQVTFGKLDFVLLGGETLVGAGIGTIQTGSTQISVNAEAIEVPQELLGKLA